MRVRNFVLYLGCSLLIGETTFANPKRQVIAGPDDTVYGIAYNNGIPTRALISANNLKPPYALRNGQVLIIPGPSEHIVGDGESLQSIAEDYGINIDVLAQENNIKSPFFVTPGTHLSIPSRDTEAMAEALKPPSQEISSTTLAPLPLIKSELAPSKTASSSPSIAAPVAAIAGAAAGGAVATLPDDLAAELAQEKGTTIANDSSPKPIMGNLAEKKSTPPVATSDSADEKAKEEPKLKKVAKKEEVNEEKKPEKKEEKKDVKKEEKKQLEDQEISFIWPLKGEVISKFAAGGKNDGINIKATEGTLVKASAHGTVMYAGNELKGFGNLLLIKHQDGWVTAYAHNSELLVSKGDKVKQGQEIAKSGKTEGDAGQPQLHFEIRKVKQPIDPLTKLGS